MGCLFPVMTSALTQMVPSIYRHPIHDRRRRGEGGGIAWLVRYSVHGHVGRPEYPHAVIASRIPSLVPPRAPDPGDLSGAIHRLAGEMCLINKEETVYA